MLRNSQIRGLVAGGLRSLASSLPKYPTCGTSVLSSTLCSHVGPPLSRIPFMESHGAMLSAAGFVTHFKGISPLPKVEIAHASFGGRQLWSAASQGLHQERFSQQRHGQGAAMAAQLCSQRGFAKRPKKWKGLPFVLVKHQEGVPVPPSQPNKGSVKNRKHMRRMQQRALFIKMEVEKKKAERKAAFAVRDAARVHRWREGKRRAEEWKAFLVSRESSPPQVVQASA